MAAMLLEDTEGFFAACAVCAVKDSILFLIGQEAANSTTANSSRVAASSRR